MSHEVTRGLDRSGSEKSLQEVFDNDRLGFLRRKAEGPQLDELIIVDASDGRLVYDLRVEMPGVNFWDRADLSAVHNNRIALNMCLAKIFSNRFGMKHLLRVIFSHRTVNNLGGTAFAVEFH